MLAEAPVHADRVAEILSEFQYEPFPGTGSLDADGYGRLVEEAVVAQHVDVLIVHVVGHGELAEGSSEKLYVLGSDGERLSRPVGAWIDLIEDHPQRHRPTTLFVLDVCYAGEAAVTAWHSRMDVARRRAWVLAASGPGQRAFGYRLSQALVQVLEKYRTLKVRFDPSVRYIPPHTVWRDIEDTVNELAAQTGGLPQTILTSLVPGHADLSHLPFFPNPSFDHDRGSPAVAPDLPPEIARLADWAVDPLHFMGRAGGAEPVHRDWAEGYFSGRTAQLDVLTGWLDDEKAAPGLRVLTGKPGAGKSALLGVLICAAHPDLRRHTRSLWAGLGNRAPGANDRIIVVHARRLGLDDVVDSLARQLRHIRGEADDFDGGGASEAAARSPANRLLRMLPLDGRPVTVVIDALDEALRPQDITTALLLPLARQARGPGSRLRLLVGTRDDERFHGLLALARDAGDCMDLSAAPPQAVRGDVADYVRRLLAAEGPYAAGALRPVRDALAKAIADTLTGYGNGQTKDTGALQWGEFLTAGLYTHYLLTGPLPGGVEEAAALGRAVPRSLPALLELDLRRHLDDRPLLRPVLTALSFAQGRGMPESVLAQVAPAFITPTEGAARTDDATPLSLPDLYRLLDGEARFYLRRAVDDDGTTLYRLFHEGLADWLRDPVGRPLDQGASTTQGRPLGPAERLYERLLDSVPRDASGRGQWHRAVPYLLRHTAQHAISAGCLDELLDDGGFLLHADPNALADALRHARSQRARLNAAVYRASWARHHDLSPEERRQLLALDATRFRNASLRAQLHGDRDWQVRWATGSQISTALVRALTDTLCSVTAAGVVELDGRPHAVTGNNEGTVRLWDLTTGAETRELAGAHNGEVSALRVVELNGRPHAITGGEDGSVLVWDLSTGTRVRELARGFSMVTAIATMEIDGRPHAVIGDLSGEMVVWDLITAARTHWLYVHEDDIDYDEDDSDEGAYLSTVTAVELHGRPHAITGGKGPARVWDLTTGTQVAELAGGHDDEVSATAVVELAGRPHAVTGGNGRVLVWDLITGTAIRELVGHTRWVSAMEVTELEGRPHAITSAYDGSVLVWDLTTGVQVRELAGHTGAVSGVGVVELYGRPHAVTGGQDGSVLVWDLTVSAERPEVAGHTDQVSAVETMELDGRAHAVTSAFDRRVLIWDVATGVLIRELTGHTTPVHGLRVVELEGRPHAIIGSYGSVRVWDLTTGARSRELAGLRSLNAVAVAELDGRPHAVTNGDSGSALVWDLTTATRVRELTGPGHDAVMAVAVAELDGRPVAITGGSHGRVRVWDLTNGEQPSELLGHIPNGRVEAVRVVELNNRPHVVTADGLAVRVWDLTTGALVQEHFAGLLSALEVVRLDGRPYAVTGGYSVQVWDLSSGTCLTRYPCPSPVKALTVTPDATVVAGFGNEVAALSFAPLKGRLSDRPR